jgi:hypothetical protein
MRRMHMAYAEPGRRLMIEVTLPNGRGTLSRQEPGTDVGYHCTGAAL